MQRYKKLSALLKHTGGGWDPELNIVTLDKKAWDGYVKMLPAAQTFNFRMKGCDNYHKLGVLFGSHTATGTLRHASTQNVPTREEEEEIQAHFLGNSTLLPVCDTSTYENMHDS